MRSSGILEQVLRQLDSKFIGFDAHIQKLTGILDSFARTNEGGSALTVMKYAKDMEVVFIDGLLHTSDASAVGIVDELELQLKRPYIVVVLNLEQFLVRATQVLLYKVLDATRTQPLELGIYVAQLCSRRSAMQMSLKNAYASSALPSDSHVSFE
uniref:Uncharacterized protein n=1 Tax=Parascaris equorum TaxID=6256 RepID=A0A914RKL3_PAREQ